MTTRLARLFLVAALAVLLPLQGFAAVSAGQCMALGHHDTLAAGPSDPAHPVQGHGDAAHGAHAGAAADHHGGAHESADADPHCGPCVACCASASICSAAVPALAAAAAEPLPLLMLTSRAGFHPDALDRPPLLS